MSSNVEDTNEETATSEERLNWLRERGVIIETSEERRETNSKKYNESGECEKVSYVYIPHDTSKPMKEMKLKVYKEYKTAGDLMPDHLKPLFGVIGKANVDLSLFHEQVKKQQHLSSENAPKTISDATMRQLAAEGQVETFCLVKPVPSNKFTSINLYLDEVGMLKRLPLNSRVIDLATRAGFNPPPTFYGDMFIGRVSTKPRLINIDFKLGVDTALDATWMKNATMENLEYQTAMNQITGQNEIQPSNAGEDGIAKDEDGYTWTQTEEELEIVVKIENNSTTSKNMKILFRPTFVQVGVGVADILLRIELFSRIDPDGCTWTFDKSGNELKVVITCEKSEPLSWPRITF